MYLPKKARPPKIVLDENDKLSINKTLEKLNEKNYGKLAGKFGQNSDFLNNNNKEEYEYSILHNKILQERLDSSWG